MTSLFLFIGTTELLLIGAIALLLFGGKKLPEMMHGLGQGVKEFKKGVNEVDETVNGDDADKKAEEAKNITGNETANGNNRAKNEA
ncbi:tatA/E family twin arginine-targeting protein translocase [Prevotella sp. CAG:1185]|uniref:Sec-independent protein translocase subunit TatA/TatB n=1 Tax=uncultured Prevotella sp. TaxID=159272 RepID=UPI00033AB444|nr:twin-arginine translocase TatA/TatE family subunit [uncultured Prevotella sp.]CCY81512.1 tatA/E family twin arginine-targeting protein translocase [Prevotella sp. CAG:1185]